jgi:hypothetical protein
MKKMGKMVKITLIFLVTGFLVVWAGAASADSYGYAWEHRYANCCHPMAGYYCAPYVPVDIRVKMAEAERLKAELHYYAMSRNPVDMARAGWLADKLNYVVTDMETWRGGLR